MATITTIAYFVGKTIQNIDISAAGNTLTPYDLTVQNQLAFNGGAQVLTAAKQDLLLGGTASDASTLHNHDTRYNTKTELSATTGTSGAELIGTDATTNNHTPSGSTVNDFLNSIDTALASAGGTDFADDIFRISDNVDNTKKIAFQASGITTATTRTITMPDADVNLGLISTALQRDGSVTPTSDLPMGGFKLTGLGAGTAAGDAVNKSQLDAVQSIIQNFEWQESALDYVVDNTAVPASEVSGDRYILSHDGGVPHANYDGASAGDIVEFNGTVWVAVTPTVGTFISADDEPTLLYYWGGSSWGAKYFESTTASTGLTKVGFDIQLDSSSAGSGLGFLAGVLSINVDDSTVEVNTDTLRVKDLGITTAKLADGAVTEAKIGSAAVTEAKIGTGAVTADKIGTSAVTTAKIADDAVDKAKIAADVAGDGLVQATDGSLVVRGAYIEATNGNAGSITAGSIVRISAAGTFDLAQADSLANSDGSVGVLLATTSSAATGKIQITGNATVIVSGGGNLTIGSQVWLSKANAGQVTQSNTGGEESTTGNTITPVGKATGISSILINIGESIVVA